MTELIILKSEDSEADFIAALDDPDSAVHVLIMKKDSDGVVYQSCIIPGESAGINDGHLATGLGHVLGALYAQIKDEVLQIDIFVRFHAAFAETVSQRMRSNNHEWN